ncbi:hypothetical protein BU24DRAFT_420977 [Aaosphaeria arxii CBS 175.79]|uniref:Arrestin-like N-terminal domain-containing protein n=1 Tax=Aaosphaeria arxii CBS 175.79 TaxID=1450172 RepID=A0A6A5XXP3_9PLEO|nr:uncharacterized protein BU24DRAFT_420977 [Aaosphaeria arxii CBS 175.79]KAF2017932.1 hypothetical protein BU24DRAFT_420977 [Aaosphaeria arxii CBS 175.79]
MPIDALPNSATNPLYIYLHPPTDGKSKFTTGDLVQGKLQVQMLGYHQEITCTLNGFMNCNVIEDGTVQSYSTALFKIHSNKYQVYGIDSTGALGRREFPFQFRFPDTVELPPHPAFLQRSGFECSIGHTPPPSSISNMLHSHSSQIKYYIEATSVRARGNIRGLTVRQNISYIPPTPSTIKDMAGDSLIPQASISGPSHFVHIQTNKLRPESARSDSLLERLKSKRHEVAPSVSFSISAHVPQIAIMGQSLPITLSLEQTHSDLSDGQFPELFLQKICIKLTSKVTVRVPVLATGRDTDFTTSQEHILKDAEFPKNSRLIYDGVMVEELTQGTGDVTVPRIILPGFSSYAINNAWEIQIIICGICAGEKFTRVVCKGPIRVYSGFVRSPVSRDDDHALEGEEIPPTEELPTYEQAIRSS